MFLFLSSRLAFSIKNFFIPVLLSKYKKKRRALVRALSFEITWLIIS
jgi:hypothetical protein